MAKNDNLKDFVTDIANAIREKKGITDLINPQNFSDEILSLETGGEVIKVDSLPDTNIENDKFYIVEELLLYIIDLDNGFSDYLIFENPPIYVDSINNVSNPIFGGNVPQIYVDKTDYIGYIFTSETDKITLAEMLNLQAGMQLINGGKISQVEDATQSGVYFVPSAEAQTIGIPDSNYNKKVYKYNGFNWEHLGLNKYDVAGKWKEISTSNIYEFKIDGTILVNEEYNFTSDNYKIIDDKVYILDVDGNQSVGLIYVQSEGSTNLARIDDKTFIYNKIEDFKGDEKTLDYDQASGIWYASSLDDNGKAESIMYYILPLLQDENGKRNVKVYSADAEGFYDSSTEGMTYHIDGNQIKLQFESEGEVNDVGSFDYEVVDNKVHLTSEGEIAFTKIVTGLGANDNGQFVSNYIPQNGLYNSVTLNDPEALFFNAVIDVKGSETAQGQYNVKVIDYDGTILKEEYLNEGDVFTLPDAPTHHERLQFQTWSSTMDIIDNTITVGDNDVMVGAIYTTKSGLNEFDITLTKTTGLDVTLNINGVKDWGDGTSDESTAHTYANYGDYTIMCNGSNITSSSAMGTFGQSTNKHNSYCKRIRLGQIQNLTGYSFAWCASLESVTLSDNVTNLGTYAFRDCYSINTFICPTGIHDTSPYTLYGCYRLRMLVIPNNIRTINNNFCTSCYTLQDVVIPNGVTQISSYAFSSCYGLELKKLPMGMDFSGQNSFASCHSLKGLVIPEGVTYINNTFIGCYSLTSIVIPSTLKTIGAFTFSGCYSVMKYDFTALTSIPSLSNSNAFNFINKLCRIYVPDALYDQWITATNWSTYADYIYKASEMPTE